MPLTTRLCATALLALLLSPAAGATGAGDAPDYVFSWPFIDRGGMAPRGGITRGPEVTLAPQPDAAWEALQEPGLSALEKDRRAILAMAGGYRTSFDFLETVGYTAGYEPPPPYRSWGTEYVYVVADEPRYISLQHVIVMFFEEEDGAVTGPMVVKHWRQDWRYEDRRIIEYAGHDVFQRRDLSEAEAAGTWSQAVYQVDDSPRYESWGRWQHLDGYSSWISQETSRPLPRREFSVRDDYHLLYGTNRHSIVPGGWTHEENNLKVVLDETGAFRAEQPYLAREIGVNRYQRIVDFDFSAGDDYWSRTAAFWGDVVDWWESAFDKQPRLVLKKNVDGANLFMRLFEYADGIESKSNYDAAAAGSFIDTVMNEHVSTDSAAVAGGDY